MAGAVVTLVTTPGSADPSGCPSATASITVHLLPGTATRTVTADELLPVQTVNEVYPTRAFAGQAQPDPQPVTCGVPVSALLSDVGLGPGTASFVGIQHVGDSAAPSWSTLTHEAIFDPSAYPGGLVPVIYFDGNGVNGYTVRYLRPLTADPDDVNVPDKVNAAPGSTFDLYVGDGSLLTVTATASPTTARAGQPITFTAAATPAVASTTYRWDFGPGAPPVTGGVVTHVFRAAGTYDVSVLATSPDGSAGTLANPLSVTVGAVAPSSPSPTPTPSSSGTAPPSSPHPGTTSSPTGPASGGPGATGSPDASGAGAAGPPTPTASPGRVEPSATPPPVTVRLAGDARPIVHGRVLGAVAADSDGSVPGGQRASATGGAASTPRRVVAGVTAGLAIMLLLGLGAGRELRGSGWPRRAVGRQR